MKIIKLNPLNWIFKSKYRAIIFLILMAAAAYLFYKNKAQNEQKVKYQTAKVEKGDLIVTVSASGTVQATNNAWVTTQTSGVVKNIYVKNGQQVSTGDLIAEVELDMEGQQRATQAWANYQNAKNALDTAQNNLYSLQSALFSNWKAFMDAAQSPTYQNSDGSPKIEERQLPDFYIKSNDWLSAEAKYKNQQNVIAAAQTSLNSAWVSYQQASPFIYAPISGTISGLSLQVGSVLTAQTGTSGNSTSQKIASIFTSAVPLISVNLTEADISKVKIGNKATVTLDALRDKTFTGKVVSLDLVGNVSSGVTTYPAVIQLDTENKEILSNMSAQANIITQTKNEVLLIPSSAIKTKNEGKYVEILKNGKISEVFIETGISSSFQTEILSGLNEGENVIVGSISPYKLEGNKNRSPFSSFGGGGIRFAR